MCIFICQCHGHASLDAFFDGVMSGPTKIGVIGCGCSVATEPVAEIIHRWNIPLVHTLNINFTTYSYSYCIVIAMHIIAVL